MLCLHTKSYGHPMAIICPHCPCLRPGWCLIRSQQSCLIWQRLPAKFGRFPNWPPIMSEDDPPNLEISTSFCQISGQTPKISVEIWGMNPRQSECASILHLFQVPLAKELLLGFQPNLSKHGPQDSLFQDGHQAIVELWFFKGWSIGTRWVPQPSKMPWPTACTNGWSTVRAGWGLRLAAHETPRQWFIKKRRVGDNEPSGMRPQLLKHLSSTTWLKQEIKKRDNIYWINLPK